MKPPRAEDHLRLVYSIAQAYRRGHNNADVEELIQEGVIGLMRAVKKFDPSRGVQFSTYAVWWIRAAMNRAIEEKSLLVSLPNQVFREARKAGTLPSRPASLDKPIVLQGGEPGSWHDAMADEFAANPESEAEAAELRAAVRVAVTTLSARQQRMLEMRFAEERTLAEAGAELGVCRARARQIEAEALATLRGRLKAMAA